jgi:hypothetical protein
VNLAFSEFESFRAELRSLADSTQEIQSRTLRDDDLRERFRTLFRVWVSSVEPSVKQHAKNTREVFKLSAEIEKLAQLASKYKPVSEYRKRLRVARQLADGLVIYLPAVQIGIPTTGKHDLFIAAIPDLPVFLVPNAIVGWKSRMEAFCRDYPFEKSVFIMIRYRRRTKSLIKSVKDALAAENLFGVVASEHSITDDLYNPIACLLCCSRGIAIFDKAEDKQVFNPNVAYELGMLHLLGRRCLLLRHKSLQTLQTDILMKLYEPFLNSADTTKLTSEWVRQLSEEHVGKTVLDAGVLT